MDLNLAPGSALTNTWDPIEGAWYWADSQIAPAHTCPAHKDTRNDPGIGLVLEPYIDSKPARSYANGTLTFAPDFSSASVLESFASASNVKWTDKALQPADTSKPAVIVCRLASPYIMTKASGVAAGTATAELSLDDGKTFKSIELKNFDAAVRGNLAALVRLTFKESLRSIKLDVVVQNNPARYLTYRPARTRLPSRWPIRKRSARASW